MAAAQHVSGLSRAVTVILALVFLGGLYIAILDALRAVRRHRQKRRARLRDRSRK